MTINTIYTRFQSSLGEGLAPEKTIIYNLCVSNRRGREIYGINIISLFDGKREEGFLTEMSEDKGLVEETLRYLYENCVDDTCFKDVIADMTLELRRREELAGEYPGKDL